MKPRSSVAICITALILFVGSIHATAEQQTGYPTAILSFQERGDAAAGMGSKIGDLLRASLTKNPKLDLLDRAEVATVLEESGLKLSGAVNQSQAIQIGQLSGAQIVVTGSVIAMGDKTAIVAKIIGTETGRAMGASVRHASAGDLDAVVSELGNKINDLITKNGAIIVASKKRNMRFPR